MKKRTIIEAALVVGGAITFYQVLVALGTSEQNRKTSEIKNRTYEEALNIALELGGDEVKSLWDEEMDKRAEFYQLSLSGEHIDPAVDTDDFDEAMAKLTAQQDIEDFEEHPELPKAVPGEIIEL